LDIRGVTRGARCWTTQADDSLQRPADLVNRQFVAERPNQLWVVDITYVAKGFVYIAFVTDGFSRHIVGWQVSGSLHTERVLAALEQTLWSRIGYMPPAEFEIRYYQQLEKSFMAA
jgi:putative transposase